MIFGCDTDSRRQPNSLGSRGRIGQRDERIQQGGIELDRKVLPSRIWVARGELIEKDDVLRSPYSREAEAFRVDRRRGYQFGSCQVANSDCKKAYLHLDNPC